MNESKPRLANVIGIGQIAVMVVGFASLIYSLGEKSTELRIAQTNLEKLAATVSDLARAQASGTVNDAMHGRTLEDIQRRLGSIESKIR